MNVKTLCLGALCLHEGTGYDLKRLFEDTFSHFHSASYGSIYPALSQLLDEGLATVRVEPGEKHPDRKLYSVSEVGRRAFLKALTQTPPTEKVRSEFLVLLFFAHLLPVERLQEVLDEVEQTIRGELEHLDSITEDGAPTPGIQFTIDYGRHIMRAKLEFLLTRREQLLEEMRSGFEMGEFLCEE